jgi:cytochrome c oxidase subunit 4
MSGHISPKSTYYAVFGALMLGTALTVGAAFIDFPANLNFPIALAIAITKATLVILFFMHVKYGSRLTKLVVGTAFFFLGILLTLTFSDYLSRGWYTAPAGSTSPGSILSLTGPGTTGRPELEGAPQNQNGRQPEGQNTSPK